MEIENNYDYLAFSLNRAYLFESRGKKGVIVKQVKFTLIDKNRYNLGFGDLKNGVLDGKIILGNGDLVKVMSTIALIIFDFLEHYPNAIIEVLPVDEKRKKLYHTIFRRKYPELKGVFEIRGLVNKKFEAYQQDLLFDKFEIRLKK